jgi:hypothetical protein
MRSSSGGGTELVMEIEVRRVGEAEMALPYHKRAFREPHDALTAGGISHLIYLVRLRPSLEP